MKEKLHSKYKSQYA